MTTYIPPKKGAEYIFYAGLVSQSTGQFQANPTIAAGDFKVSIDGGALNNLATLPAVTPATSRMVKFTLSTSEMNGDNITVVGVDAAGSEWDEIIVNIQTAATQIDGIAAAVWDEVLTAATHNVASSAGKRLRVQSDDIVHTGTCQSGSTANTVVLDTGASSTNGTYDPSIVLITGGTGVGQSRFIIDYVGATRTGTLARDWRVVPDNTSTFSIISAVNLLSTNEGLATGAGANTITLNSSASAINDTYIGQTIVIRTGTGQDQSRLIVDYVGATKVATVGENWVTQPNTTSGYMILHTGRAYVGAYGTGQAPLQPTVAGRTLDVTAAGEAGIDWANIGGPTTVVNLSGTTVKTATDVETDTANIQTRLPAALSGDGFMKADLKSIEDELTSGNNATLHLKKLNIINSAGLAVDVSGTTGGMHIEATDDDTIALNIESEGVNGIGVNAFGFLASIFAESDGGKSIVATDGISVSDGDLTLAAIASAVWANATRTLTAISDSAGITTLLTRISQALTFTVSGKVDANITHVIADPVQQNGADDTNWGGAP